MKKDNYLDLEIMPLFKFQEKKNWKPILNGKTFLCLKIDVGDIREDAADNEVFLYITDKPFNFPLGERMPRLTQFCFEASVFMNCS